MAAHARRRAIFLLEMLPVLLALAVGGTMITMAITSILRSQQRVIELSNRYAVLEDFLSCIRRDVRAATNLAFERGAEGAEGPILEILAGTGRVTYRFPVDRVERIGRHGDTVADKLWDFEHTAFRLTLDPSPDGRNRVVGMTILWHRTTKDDPEPHRRFDVAMRCAGVSPHE